MKKTFLKQCWVAIKIWVVALALNTVLGSIYLSGHLDQDLMFFGLVLGSIVSLPIMVILLIVINIAVSRRKDGHEIFGQVLAIGAALTVFFTIFFLALIPGPLPLLFISSLSALAGICSQYKACLRLAKYDEEYQRFLA